MHKDVWFWRGAVLLLLGVVLYAGGLGRYHLLDPDEGRYGEVPREMLESGDFITPTLNYVKYFEKPPLFYWLIAASMRFFGEQEWAVRVVAVVAGMLTAWTVWSLGGAMWGARTGVIALWVYLGSLLPLVLARLPIIDGLFGACLTGCFAAWWRGYAAERGRRTGWMVLSWACLGLAVMAKGPTAVVLAALLVAGFLGWRREWGVVREMAWLPGLVVFALITVPWHVAVSLRNPEFAHFYFVVQHLLRAVGSEHLKPWWFFLVITPAGMGAWMIPSVLALVAAVGESSKRSARRGEDDVEGAAGLFCVLWVAVVVLLFSLSKCKLVPYIQPALPGLALVVGWRLAAGDAARRSWRVALAVSGALLLAVVAVAPKLAADQDVVPVSAIGPLVLGLRVSLAVAGLAMLLGAWRVRWAAWAPSLPVLLLTPVLVLSIPLFAQYKRTGALIEPMLPRLPANLTIAEYRNYDQSLSFYTHRRIVLVDFPDELAFGRDQGDNSAWFPSGAESLRELSAQGPLLVNIAAKSWPEARAWEFLRPVAANTSNIMLANEAFFYATGFAPYEPDEIGPAPRLLMPKDARGGL